MESTVGIISENFGKIGVANDQFHLHRLQPPL
jgi:hypothetical protein